MPSEFIQAAIMGILRELLRQFPQLAPAVLLAEIQNMLEDGGAAFVKWYEDAKTWPRLEYDDSGTPTGYWYDSTGTRRHYTQG